MKLGLYPEFISEDEKYPGGESVVDLGERSKKAITELLLPHVWKAAKEGSIDTHLAVVGHRRCLYEMIYELLQMSSNQAITCKFDYTQEYDYLENANWIRVVIDIKVRVVEQMVIHKLTRGAQESQSIHVDQHPPMVMDVTYL
jgi:broad specificity phosphatase PhoE